MFIDEHFNTDNKRYFEENAHRINRHSSKLGSATTITAAM
jgi:hypothetical protein